MACTIARPKSKMTGTNLLKNLVRATGLPHEAVQREVDRLMQSSGKKAEELTLDDLRELLAEYLQDVLLSAKDEFSP